MKIKSVHLKNFKRFTDLMVKDIPETAKLVVVVGPNGSGKSSLFDGLLHWYRQKVGLGYNSDLIYFKKQNDEYFDWSQAVNVTLYNSEQPVRGCLYIRTAYRNDPDFSLSGINRPASPTERVRFERVIDNDQTVSENFQRLVYDTMSGVYDSVNNEKTVIALREELIGGIRTSMKSVFGDLVLNQISDPLGSGSFFFEKGAIASYHYKNLSGGEKSAFDLLLDLHIKKRYYPSAVFCIDELETHLHTKIQGKMLKEIVNIIPENSQLWVTTHSLGVIRAAQEIGALAPGSVCMIDFDNIDTDTPHEIVPSNLGRVSWEKMLSIALDDLSTRVAPSFIIVCEGSSVGNRRKDFDAEIYNRILGQTSINAVFVSGGSSNQVTASGVSISHMLKDIIPQTKVVSLCDRDDKSDSEVAEFEKRSGIVLSRRNLESFLFDDEVVDALLVREGKTALRGEALTMKSAAIFDSVGRGNPVDDIKSASGKIYVELKRLLQLQRCGNDKDTFMRDTLAPLIKPPMKVFYEMESLIINRLSQK